MINFEFLRGTFRISAFLEFLQETSLTSYLLPEPMYSGGLVPPRPWFWARLRNPGCWLTVQGRHVTKAGSVRSFRTCSLVLGEEAWSCWQPWAPLCVGLPENEASSRQNMLRGISPRTLFCVWIRLYQTQEDRTCTGGPYRRTVPVLLI